jgi:uncharacterized protein (UPF0179 family)
MELQGSATDDCELAEKCFRLSLEGSYWRWIRVTINGRQIMRCELTKSDVQSLEHEARLEPR